MEEVERSTAGVVKWLLESIGDKARQIGFTVYRPCPHAIPGNSPKCHFSL